MIDIFFIIERVLRVIERVNNIYFKPGMSNSRQQNISEESDHPELEFQSIKNEVSNQESERPNILDQAFILFSDDEVQSNSQSFTDRDSRSDLSNISRQSSSSSIDNYEENSQSGQSSNFLKSLSHANEESSAYNIHESECSQSGIELLHALQPLFKGKVFLRRSPRFAEYGATQSVDTKVENTKLLMNKNEQQGMIKKSIESQMIEDEKPTQIQNTLSSRIIEQKYQIPTSIFTNAIRQNQQHQPQMKQQQPNPFIRFTRSSKKNINEENQFSFANVDKTTTLNLFSSNNNQSMNDSEYISHLTKDFLIMNRKEKRIKKYQQKQNPNSYSLKGLRKKTNSFQRPSN